jgi:hypothetical protein
VVVPLQDVAAETGSAVIGTVAVLFTAPVVGAWPVTLFALLVPCRAHHVGTFVFTVTVTFPPVAAIPEVGDLLTSENTTDTSRRSFAVAVCAGVMGE